MAVSDGFMGAVGNTPLIRLRRLSEETGCEILGKAEFMNPGGSVKDRAAKWIVLDAERRGTLKPGGTVVEGTAGNTGIGLAHVCNARGYRCVIVMPDNQAAEKYADHRGSRCRTAQGARGSLQQSQSVSEGGRPVGRGAAERSLGESIRQHGQSPRALRVHRPGDLARHRRESGRVLRRHRHRRHLGGSRRLPQVSVPGGAHRAGRSAGQLALSLFQGRRARDRTAAHRSPKGSAPGASLRISRERRSTTRCESRTPRRCVSFIACCARKACCSAARRASTSPPLSCSPGKWVRATRS